MSNLDIVWDNVAGRGDWRVTSGGRMSTGNLLVSAVLISLFTDRVAPSDSVGNDRHGWWMDTFDGIPIGSRLWQLRRRKIANRSALILEATDMIREALQWMIVEQLASAVLVSVTSPQAGSGQPGSLLLFSIVLVQPDGSAPLIRTLWSTV